MDPQQRLLLEVACEALEHAGIPAQARCGERRQEFSRAHASASTDTWRRGTSVAIDAWTGTGGALSIIANRLSYFLDLRGPSVAVDTACSSSLVAIHLACQSLRSGESATRHRGRRESAAVPGGYAQLRPGRRDVADRSLSCVRRGADGFVRGEGCGVVVLKRLADAQRDGDRVLAVVRGSAVNQDGRSNGLMAPNPAAQIAVLRAACANAGIQPREVDYVEAHGTGTLLGDPIEARALGTVFGEGRPDGAPLLIGSVKTNLGHLEAAAGVAGFIKAVLAVQHGHIPRNLHFECPNPHIPFDDYASESRCTNTKIGPQPGVSAGRGCRRSVSAARMRMWCSSRLRRWLRFRPAPAAPAVSTLVVSGKTRRSGWRRWRGSWRTGWWARARVWPCPRWRTP